MNGLLRNTRRLFSDRDKLFVLAMDHAQGGLVQGLERPYKLLSDLAGTAVDGYILNAGVADAMARPELLKKKLILRSSFGGTSLSSEYTNVHRNHVSPETALSLGADAVLMMFVMGGADYRSVQDAAAAIDGYHRLSIPVIAEILCSDYGKTNTFDVQANGARVAAELGADVVKVFYTDRFDKVVEYCPKPVILAGGPKDRDIRDVARAALQAGAKGLAFGRNLFQCDDPAGLIGELSQLF